MSTTDTEKQEKQEALREFVRTLCGRKAEDIEKVLLHILDTSRGRWNKKASEALRTLRDKDSGLDAAALQTLKETYDHAFNQSIKISQMRYGVAKKKRVFGDNSNSTPLKKAV